MVKSRVEIGCERCGHLLGIALEVPHTSSEEDVRNAVTEHLGTQTIRCPRCGSRLFSNGGKLELELSPRAMRAKAAEEQRKKIRGVRFAVGEPAGPRSEIWRLWTNKSDVYIAARSGARESKVSLHESGKWRSAFSERHVKGANSLVPPGADRALQKWERPDEFAPGWTRAFVIIVPASEVQPSEVVVEKPEEILWLPRAAPGNATYFNVLLSKPGATGAENRGFATAEGAQKSTEVVTAFDLASGERLWLVAHERQLPEGLVEQIETVRRFVTKEAHERIREPLHDEPYDLHSYLLGEQPDGTWYEVGIRIPVPEQARVMTRR